jgi:hypothetical protein
MRKLVKLRKIILGLSSGIISVIICVPAQASLQIFSRSCSLPAILIGIESVTVDYSTISSSVYMLKTSSSHFTGVDLIHTLDSGASYERAWRSYASHGWVNDIQYVDLHVIGDHYEYDTSNDQVNYLGQTAATDCNIQNWGLEYN